MKKIGLASPSSNETIDLDKLENKRVYPVDQIVQDIKSGPQRMVILEYDEEGETDLNDPDAIIIGTLPKESVAGTSYNQAYVVYEEKPWQLVSDQQMELFSVFSGIKSEDAKKLRDILLEDRKNINLSPE